MCIRDSYYYVYVHCRLYMYVYVHWPLCISHCCFYRLMFINLIQSKFKVDFVLLSFVMSSSVKCFHANVCALPSRPSRNDLCCVGRDVKLTQCRCWLRVKAYNVASDRQWFGRWWRAADASTRRHCHSTSRRVPHCDTGSPTPGRRRHRLASAHRRQEGQ